jgi:hypothetical protein
LANKVCTVMSACSASGLRVGLSVVTKDTVLVLQGERFSMLRLKWPTRPVSSTVRGAAAGPLEMVKETMLGEACGEWREAGGGGGGGGGGLGFAAGVRNNGRLALLYVMQSSTS